MEIENNNPEISLKQTHCDVFPILNDISYNEFFENYLLKNQACLIKNVSSDWESTQNWIAKGNLNWTYLYSKYGSSDVTVYDCNDKYYNSQKTRKMKLMQYLVYWESYIKSSYSKQFPVLYLKDWHLRNESEYDNFYRVPKYFTSDWLNEYLVQNRKDDYRFVYMGPKGSWTPFHADVFTSYSWSVNIFGKKRWLLLPPGQENLLRDNLGNLPYDIEPLKDKVQHFEIIQNAGDAIFVPSGWYHQVWNVADTVSINHNWINGCNIKTMWFDLLSNLNAVKKEIGDCSDMENFEEHCQVILKASSGIDYKDFSEFVCYIGRKRCDCSATSHVLFDLRRIREVLNLFLENSDVQNLFGCKLNCVEHVLADVENILKEK